MSDQKDVHRRLHELLDPVIRDGQSAGVGDDLARMLRESESARRMYVDYIDDTVNLVWWGSHADADDSLIVPLAAPQPAEDQRRRRIFDRSTSAAITAAACLAVIGLFFVGQRDAHHGKIPAPRDSSGSAPSVATLVRSVHAEWRPAHPAPADFARLKAGNRIELAAGQVELLFDSGVELVARGPCRLEIKSENSIIADRGSIFARVGEAGRGFTVETPSTTLVDLGTEFGVEINEDGGTDVAVFTGMVDVGGGQQDDDQAERLFQGDAVHVAGDGVAVRLTAFDDAKFPAPGAATVGPVRLPVIAEVRDNIADGHVKKAYCIVRRGFWEDSQAFVDRRHEWNGVDASGLPPELLGGEYVMPFNDDKFFKDLRVAVDIARPATVYVLISDTVPLPSWLGAEFVDTGWSVGLDEGPFEWRPDQTTEKGPGRSIETVFSVWKRVVPAPATLELGGVSKHPTINEGYNMYGIVAVPIDDAR